jgi:hypothetical protein
VQIAEWNQIDSKGIQFKAFARRSKVRIGSFPTIGNNTTRFWGQPLCKITWNSITLDPMENHLGKPS